MPKIYHHARRGLGRGAPQPPGICHSKYDVELGGAICQRIAAGEAMRTICDRNLAMPTSKTVRNWARAHPDFALMLQHARETACAAAQARNIAAEAARRAAALAARRYPRLAGRASGYSPDLAERIIVRLLDGEPLTAICRDPAMPFTTTVYKWLRREPEFRRNYRCAREAAADVLVTIARETSPWLGDERASLRLLERRTRAAETRAAALSAQHYGPSRPLGPLQVVLKQPDGSERVIYDGTGLADGTA
jgi:hypothetical protein